MSVPIDTPESPFSDLDRQIEQLTQFREVIDQYLSMLTTLREGLADFMANSLIAEGLMDRFKEDR